MRAEMTRATTAAATSTRIRPAQCFTVHHFDDDRKVRNFAMSNGGNGHFDAPESQTTGR
jgi:hypothetical protein